MLSKAKIKFIKSLQVKKYRKQEQCFVVQGAKSVYELLASDFEVVSVIGTDPFLDTMPDTSAEIIRASEKELTDLSEFQTNDSALAVARLRKNENLAVQQNEYALVLYHGGVYPRTGAVHQPGRIPRVTKIICIRRVPQWTGRAHRRLHHRWTDCDRQRIARHICHTRKIYHAQNHHTTLRQIRIPERRHRHRCDLR